MIEPHKRDLCYDEFKDVTSIGTPILDQLAVAHDRKGSAQKRLSKAAMQASCVLSHGLDSIYIYI